MPNDSVSRRDLAKQVVLGTGATLLGLSNASAEEESQNAPSSVDLTTAWLFDRYPSEHLTDEQIVEIHRDVRRKQIQSAILHQYPLEPADAPALVFSAYRSEE